MVSGNMAKKKQVRATKSASAPQTYGYSKKVLEIFQNPKNIGEIKNPDGFGKVGNPSCGDLMYMYLRISKDGRDRILDIKIKTFGCLGAISSSSILTEMVKGMTIEQALKVTKDQVVKELGGLPPIKIHCSILSVDALKEDVYDYYKKTGRKITKDLQEAHERNERVCIGIEHMH